MMTLLLNDLMALTDDVYLLLDDYHVIESTKIHHAMTLLIEHLPLRVHLVIATRTEPPLPLSRYRARGMLVELRLADLRFTTDEAAGFLNRTTALSLSLGDVAVLESCTEGWIAGLQLAGLWLEGRGPAFLTDIRAAVMGARRHIFDYLADEVFSRQSDEVRSFLLTTSVLDRLSGGLCDALADEPGQDKASHDGKAMLERLDDANLFLVPLDDTSTWYRYHHLFLDFLRERLHREQPRLVPELHRRACRWYEQHGPVEDAASHALAAGDSAHATHLVEQAIPTMIWQRGEVATLRRWLEQLARDVARLRPRLCLDLAWVALWSGQPDDVEPRLQDSEEGLRSASPDALFGTGTTIRAMHGEIAAIRAELARQQGDLVATINLARRALADLPSDDRRVRAVTTGLLAGAYFWSGDAAGASAAYRDALALSQTSSTIVLGLIAGGRLVLTQAAQGLLRQGAASYKRTRELAAAFGMSATPWIGVAQVGMAEIAREWNDLATAEDLARQGTAHCKQTGGLAEMALDGYLTLARIVQARGDLVGALGILEDAERYARDNHIAQFVERVGGARAWLWLTAGQGDVASAERWASSRAAAWRAETNPGYVSLLERLVLARLHIVQRRYDDAAVLLRWLLRRAEAGSLLGCVIEILLLQARIFHEQDNTAQAMLTLTRALTLAEAEGHVRRFVDEGTAMVALLRHARARGVMPDRVSALLAACGDSAMGPATPELVEHLSIREQELLRLLAAGLSTPEIAAALVITTGTVRNHLKNIYGKLNVHSRLQAVERARAFRLL